MKKEFSFLVSNYKIEKEEFGISSFWFTGTLIFPFLIVFLVSLFLIIPNTQEFTKSLLEENHIVELLTFIFLFLGSILGFKIAFWSYSKKMKSYVWIFLILFSFFLFIVSMEEIAWGQQFFKFKTPDIIKPLNAQGELTLHNFNGLQGKSEYFRLFFGIGGLAGFLFKKFNWMPLVSPPKILIPFFVIITVISSMDLFADYFSINEMLDKGLKRLSELIEMLIGLSGLLYIIFISRKLKTKL